MWRTNIEYRYKDVTFSFLSLDHAAVTTLLFPHRKNTLSCQSLLNPKDYVFVGYSLLIDEKWLHGAGPRSIRWQRKSFRTCQKKKKPENLVARAVSQVICSSEGIYYLWGLLPERKPRSSRVRRSLGKNLPTVSVNRLNRLLVRMLINPPCVCFFQLVFDHLFLKFVDVTR